jgi:hypothetical protein
MARVSRVAGEHAFYSIEKQGWPSDRAGRPRSAGVQLDRLLAQAGGARGLLRRPARRFLGRRPRRGRGGGHGPDFSFRTERGGCEQ